MGIKAEYFFVGRCRNNIYTMLINYYQKYIQKDMYNVFKRCFATFPGMFGDIPRVLRIPFPVPVFLVLYIAYISTTMCLN